MHAKFGWNWPSGSGERDENVKSFQTDGRIDRRMTDYRQSEKLTWAFSSGKLIKVYIFYLKKTYITKHGSFRACVLDFFCRRVPVRWTSIGQEPHGDGGRVDYPHPFLLGVIKNKILNKKIIKILKMCKLCETRTNACRPESFDV